MHVTSLEQLTCAAFVAAVKTKFRVWTDAQNSVELELTEVTSPRLTPAGGATGAVYENFTLLFRGPADCYLPQRIYTFDSAALGRFELFIVPVNRDTTGLQYQATFNRVVKKS